MARTIWPKVPSSFVSAMLAGHSALGLAFAALIYVVCLSGTVLVAAHEIDRWENPEAPIVEAIETGALVKAAHAGISKAKAAGTHDYVVVTTAADGHPNLSVRFADFQTGIDESFVATKAGDIVGARHNRFSHFMEHLHIFLHLPETIGLFVVGLIGVSLLSSVWSGVFSHPRIFRDAFRFRRGGTKRLEEADLHNRLSVWGLPFHIIVPLTGAVLGLSTMVLGILAVAAFNGDTDRARAVVGGPNVPHSETPAPLPDIAPIIDGLLAQHPDARLARLGLREFGTEGQSVQIDLSTAKDLTVTDRYIFDGSGTFLGARGFADGSLGTQVIGALGPLHFGWFSNGWIAGLIKTIYVALGLALTSIVSSGVAIWIARRRDKGKPVPGWEKAWTATVWGQPLAYCAVALLALANIGLPALPVYLIICAAAFSPAMWISNLSLSRSLRLLTSAALVLVVIAHVIRFKPLPLDPMATLLNTALLAVALCIAMSINPIRQMFARAPAIQPLSDQ